MAIFRNYVHCAVLYCMCIVPSVLWRCWLGGRKGIQPEWWGAGVVVCLERGADLHIAQLMPLPFIVSCFSEIQIGFTLLVPAHLGIPRKRAVKRVCVYILCSTVQHWPAAARWLKLKALLSSVSLSASVRDSFSWWTASAIRNRTCQHTAINVTHS